MRADARLRELRVFTRQQPRSRFYPSTRLVHKTVGVKPRNFRNRNLNDRAGLEFSARSHSEISITWIYVLYSILSIIWR
jgi:hypothetical protein